MGLGALLAALTVAPAWLWRIVCGSRTGGLGTVRMRLRLCRGVFRYEAVSGGGGHGG